MKFAPIHPETVLIVAGLGVAAFALWRLSNAGSNAASALASSAGAAYDSAAASVAGWRDQLASIGTPGAPADQSAAESARLVRMNGGVDLPPSVWLANPALWFTDHRIAASPDLYAGTPTWAGP